MSDEDRISSDDVTDAFFGRSKSESVEYVKGALEYFEGEERFSEHKYEDISFYIEDKFESDERDISTDLEQIKIYLHHKVLPRLDDADIIIHLPEDNLGIYRGDSRLEKILGE